MNNEQSLMLACLRDFCHGVKTPKPDYVINEEKLCETAETHSVTGIIYNQCSEWLRSKSRFRERFLTDVFYSVNRAEMLKEFNERCSASHIPYVCMKGSVIRNSWPVPELRSMGDTDIIIHQEDRETVDRILKNDMGFSRMIDNHAVWTYWYEKLEFEVHDHMFYEHLANDTDYRLFFDDIWNHIHSGNVYGIESECLKIPEENYHFLYMMTHTAKHIINGGIGFRAFMDMVFVTEQWELDWEWLETELEKLKLLEFTKTCFALCRRWFDAEMPLEDPALSEEFFRSVTEKMFKDGIFGLENSENTEAHSAREIKRSHLPYWITAVILTLKKLFPPYRDMQLIPWYSWVDGRPWLMPAAWIYRWIYCIKNKYNHSRNLLKEPFSNKEKIEKRENMIKNWGL